VEARADMRWFKQLLSITGPLIENRSGFWNVAFCTRHSGQNNPYYAFMAGEIRIYVVRFNLHSSRSAES